MSLPPSSTLNVPKIARQNPVHGTRIRLLRKVSAGLSPLKQVTYNQFYFLVHRLHTDTTPSFVVDSSQHHYAFTFLSLLVFHFSLHLFNPSPERFHRRHTVDQLVAKNIEAKGGAAAISGIKSLRLPAKC